MPVNPCSQCRIIIFFIDFSIILLTTLSESFVSTAFILIISIRWSVVIFLVLDREIQVMVKSKCSEECINCRCPFSMREELTFSKGLALLEHVTRCTTQISLILLAAESTEQFLGSWWQKYLWVFTISAIYPTLDGRWSLGHLWLNFSRQSLEKVRFSHFMANVDDVVLSSLCSSLHWNNRSTRR